MVFKIGGLLQVGGGNINLVNSTIGALGLTVPADAHLNVSGLTSGVYFKKWDVHNMIPEADYNLTLKKSHILKDDFTGDLMHGPYERGWLFFIDPDAHVRIDNSELRKVFIDLLNEEGLVFENLKIGIPSDFNYKDIFLSNITMMGEWPFTIIDANVTFKNSEYLFLQPSGESIVTLINSHIVEFIPRDYFGTIIFENGLWSVAGEIIGGTPYHSMENNFDIKGSLRIEGLRESLKWKEAQVTREYEVIVKDSNNDPREGISVIIDGNTYYTYINGRAYFSLIHDENNYNQPRILQISNGGGSIVEEDIDFFTETPIVIIVN